ncbi:uncharacterized protein LOC144433998 [Glandiceps talaboti]
MAFHHTACFVFTVMIVCNAVLYPSIFSSIFRQWFGSGEKEEGAETPMYPPHMRHHGPRNPSARGPIAGERAAQQMAAQQAQKQDGGGKSRGMMSSILPVYAIGIVGYFAYIMYRIFFKEQDQKDPLTGQPVRGAWTNRQTSVYDDPVEERRREQAESLQRTLQQDLRGERHRETRKTPKTQVPSNNDDESEIVGLQKRLEDTERAMQKMMEYMNKMGVAMSQVTEQMAQNENPDKSNSASHKGLVDAYMNNHDEVYHDEEDFDEDEEYEEEIVVKKVPIRKVPVRRKVPPTRKVVGRRVRLDQSRAMKTRDYPRKRVVYVREVDDNESDDIQDKFDDYVKEDRYVDHDEDDDDDGEDEEDNQVAYEHPDEDAYEDEDDDMDDEDEREDGDDDDDDADVEELGSETLLPESDSQNVESENLRKRKVQANSQENDDA